MTETTSRICTFRVNGLLLGLKVSDVQEVVKSQHITPVPLAPPLCLDLSICVVWYCQRSI